MKQGWKNKLKWVGIAAITILIVVIILQNTTPVETKILFVTLEMPRALLLFFATATGFVLGILVSIFLRSKGRKEHAPSSDSTG